MLHRTVADVVVESDADALAATQKGIGLPRRGVDVRERGLDAVIVNVIREIGAEPVTGTQLAVVGGLAGVVVDPGRAPSGNIVRDESGASIPIRRSVAVFEGIDIRRPWRRFDGKPVPRVVL